MSALAGNDIDAADLLALARLERRRRAVLRRPAMVTARPPRTGQDRDRDMIAIAREPMDQRPWPETSGGHGAAARSPGHPPVTASREVMIAAAPGRARQQRTPALTGVG